MTRSQKLTLVCPSEDSVWSEEPPNPLNFHLRNWARPPTGRESSRPPELIFFFVCSHYFGGRPTLAKLTRVQPDYAVAEAANLVELMTHENNGAPGAGDLVHFPEAFALEFQVTHGENLINEKDFRFKVSGNCKGKPHIHSG